MKYITISSNTLFDDTNWRSCLSVDRALGMCYRCHLYKGCESRIVNSKYDNLMEKKSVLLKDLKKISQDIEEL